MGPYKKPMISIITPSYNQAEFIEFTIKSVIDQQYPGVEHIIIDGGSNDGTIEILEKYRKDGRISYISEPDRGQSHAINKGLRKARGQIIGWLNSDDTYEPGAIKKAVNALVENPMWDMVYGRGNYINEFNHVIGKYPDEPFQKKRLFEGCIICQPAAFMRKTVLDRVQGINESYQFCMDYDLWNRVAKNHTIGFIDAPLANSRVHSRAKTTNYFYDIGLPEVFRTSRENYGTIANSWLVEFIKGHYKQKDPVWFVDYFKQFSVFNQSPHVQKMNRFNHHWVPPWFNFLIQIKKEQPMKRLLIKGNYPQNAYEKMGPINCLIRSKGRTIKKIQIKEGAFVLNLPITRKRKCLVELHFDQSIGSNQLNLDGVENNVSLQIEKVVPLSSIEGDFYNTLLKKSPKQLREWMYAKRHPLPHLGD